MRKIFLFLFLLQCGFPAGSQSLHESLLPGAATTFITTEHPDYRLIRQEKLTDATGAALATLFHFEPAGFVIIANSDRIAPVYAWSALDRFDLPQEEAGRIKQIITRDLQVRLDQSWRQSADERAVIAGKWQSFLAGGLKSPGFEQWPPEGTTTTGGWLETNWTQNAPYNNMCPIDLDAGSRSVAGCPAIAMAQIVNHHREINQTRFSDSDDYYHNYGSGNQYWIDNDYLSRGFPCFDTLNLHLDTLESTYAFGGALTKSMKAALCFACGVAAHQVYTASVSGTFGLEQALMAWQRFGFEESRIVYPDDTTLNTLIAENVKLALPVQLGLLVSTGSGGHNVVVDGYNTDEYYHFNFGWGGSANGWYTLPPESIPYNLTIIESAVIDIKSSLYTGITVNREPARTIRPFPNPFTDQLNLPGLAGPATLILYNSSGKEVLRQVVTGGWQTVTTNDLTPGMYLYRIVKESGNSMSGKLIRN